MIMYFKIFILLLFTYVPLSCCDSQHNTNATLDGLIPFLLFEWKSLIIQSSFDFNVSKPVVHGDVAGFDVDSHSTAVYWTSANGFITNQKITEKTSTAEIVVRGLNDPTLIAYDWISNNVYTVAKNDEQVPVIKLCSINQAENGCATIFTLKDEVENFEVTGIAVAPQHGFVFWTQVTTSTSRNESEKEGSIWRGNMGGSESLRFDNEVLNPVGIAIDRQSNRIYWIDYGYEKVEGMNIDGSNTSTVAVLRGREWGHVKGLTVYEGKIAWIDGQMSITCKIDEWRKQDLTECTVVTNAFLSGASYPVILHPSQQPRSDDQNTTKAPCENSNCNFICVGMETHCESEIINKKQKLTRPNCINDTTVSYNCFCPDEFLPVDETQTNCLRKISVETSTRESTAVTEHSSSDVVNPIVSRSVFSVDSYIAVVIFLIGIALSTISIVFLAVAVCISRKSRRKLTSSSDDELQFEHVVQSSRYTEYLM